ncbi:hypothetical protein Tco_0995549 [Tanacetum coccineum]
MTKFLAIETLLSFLYLGVVSTFLFLEFEEVLRLLLVGSLSSLEVDSDGGVIGLAICLPLNLVVALDLVEDDCYRN